VFESHEFSGGHGDDSRRYPITASTAGDNAECGSRDHRFVGALLALLSVHGFRPCRPSSTLNLNDRNGFRDGRSPLAVGTVFVMSRNGLDASRDRLSLRVLR
jgi:hypothetical protein